MSDTLTIAVSTVADGSMLNRHDGDDAAVIANRKTFLNTHGILIDHTTRVDVRAYERALQDGPQNWCTYRALQADDKGRGMLDSDVYVADGIVTTHPGQAIALPVADCVGAVLYDPKKRILMVSHLGRHSLEQQGGIRTVRFLVDEYGCAASDIEVWLTPAVGKDVFPIWALENKGMKEVTFEQLLAAGITQKHITDMNIDTDKDERYYSYSEFLKGNRPEDGDHMIVAMMRS